MKKFTAALCTVLLLIGAVLVPGAAAAGPALANTRAYCIMDADTRSEERRVGKECRSRWSPYH